MGHKAGSQFSPLGLFKYSPLEPYCRQEFLKDFTNHENARFSGNGARLGCAIHNISGTYSRF
jgi:hypothetical protein